MTAQERIGNLLGLACRACKTICGDFAAEKHLKKHTVPMLFLAADGGATTWKSTAAWQRARGLPL